jgi:hypothetical protein
MLKTPAGSGKPLVAVCGKPQVAACKPQVAECEPQVAARDKPQVAACDSLLVAASVATLAALRLVSKVWKVRLSTNLFPAGSINN